ncbi:MAG: ATP-binding protein [bacterium]
MKTPDTLDRNKEADSTPSPEDYDITMKKDALSKRSISMRSVLSLSIIALILFISLSFYIFFQRLYNKTVEHYIRSKAIFVAKTLSIESISHLKKKEFASILEHVKILASDQDVICAAILDAEGYIIAKAPQDCPMMPSSIDIPENYGAAPVFMPLLGAKGEKIGYAVSMPIKSQDQMIGLSRVFISFHQIKKGLSHIKTGIFLVLALITFIGILTALIISNLITKPILNLVSASERIAEGHFDTDVSVGSRTEIGLLARSFHKMTNSIRRYQDKITSQSNELKAIINSMGSGLFTIDQEWRITSFNKAAERITGYKEEEVLGKKCEEVFHSEACQSECPLERALKSDSYVLSNDFFIKNKEGRKIPISASTSPLKNESGRIIGGVEVFKDLSEVKELQKQLIQADKMSALGQMVSGIAHDINNPTGVIHSNMVALSEYTAVIKDLLIQYRGLLHKGRDKGSSTEYSRIKAYEEQCDIDYILEDLDCLVEESGEAARRITQIVKDLRDFIHIDVGQLQLADLNQRLDVSLKLIKFNAKIKVIKEYSEIPPIQCNVQHIDQLFTNIILNAVQALGHKGEIKIRTSHTDGRIRISFWDNGPGIPEEIQSKIFDPFFTTKEVGEGTGLGLSICFKIVDNHGGKIWVESEPENWTEFFVELPINPIVSSER